MADDADLVRRMLAGDERAFDALLERHQDAVRRHLTRMVRDPALVDDLAQEAFLRVWTRADQWRGRAAFRTWLLRIATNLALNHLRSAKRRRQQPLELPPPPALDDGDDEPHVPAWMIDASALGPDALVELAEQRELLGRLVDGLPDAKRQVFRLAHEAELNVREIAEQLGIPEGTVKSRLHHARRKLAQQWEDLNGP